MDKDLVMPQPAVNDFSKASQKELIEEVKTLRQFTGLMLLRLRGYVEGQELSNALEERMASFEKEAWTFRHLINTMSEELHNQSVRIDALEKKEVILYEPE